MRLLASINRLGKGRMKCFGICLLPACLAIVGCSSVKVDTRRELGAAPTAKPQLIYVADFALDDRSMRTESGILPISPVAVDWSDAILPRLVGIPVEGAAREREIVNLMATSLIVDLRALGLSAYRLRPDEKPTDDGWLLHGSFTQVDEGNRLRRAVIGFGDGGTELRVNTSLSDVANGISRPFCEASLDAHSRRRPGAIFSFDPYVVAGRFMLCALDLDNNVRESAARIASDIARQVHGDACTKTNAYKIW
jgi:hypothetical protein